MSTYSSRSSPTSPPTLQHAPLSSRAASATSGDVLQLSTSTDLLSVSPATCVAFANRVIRMRMPGYRLSHLRINTGECNQRPLAVAPVCAWISTAYSLGVRHLYLGIHCGALSSVGPTLFSLVLLQSLSITLDHPNRYTKEASTLPPAPIPLLHLKSLEIENGFPHDLGRFIRELPSLEHLHLKDVARMPRLVSRTLKRLEMCGVWISPSNVHLHLPSLEHVDFNMNLQFCYGIQFHANFPAVRTAQVTLVNFDQRHVPLVGRILSSLVNINALSLCILPVMLDLSDSYNILLESEKEFPMLPNLKSFDLFTCIRKETIEDIICLLDYLPALDVLKLTRLDPVDTMWKVGGDQHWPLKSLGSTDGNMCFTSLHLGNKRAEVVNFLSGNRQLSKRLKR